MERLRGLDLLDPDSQEVNSSSKKKKTYHISEDEPCKFYLLRRKDSAPQ